MTNTDLLPDEDKWATDAEGSEDFDVTDLRVNFSKEEAESTSFENVPPGKYLVAITDVRVKTSKSTKNPGKPFYALTYTIQDGPHANRKLFDNVMLFHPALYSLSNLMKALGYDVSEGSVQVPAPAELQGQQFIARVTITPARTDPNDPSKVYEARSEVKGYFKPKTAAVGGAVKDDLAP